jgi:hypothetical protein
LAKKWADEGGGVEVSAGVNQLFMAVLAHIQDHKFLVRKGMNDICSNSRYFFSAAVSLAPDETAKFIYGGLHRNLPIVLTI